MVLPRRSGKAEPTLSAPDPTDGVTFYAVGLVAELAGDALGGKVVLERAGDGLLRAQLGEGQVECGGPHLGADSLPLLGLPEP